MRFQFIPPALAAALVVCVASPAPAQPFTWTNGLGTSVWNTAQNWNPANIPNSASTTVNFDNTGNATTGAVNVTSSVQAVVFNFTNTTGNAYTIGSNSGVALQGVASVTIGSGVTATDTINPAIIQYGADSGINFTITNNAANSSNPTLVIGNTTVISTPANGGIAVGGTGFTRISASINGGSSQDTRHGLTKSGAGRLELTGNNTGLDGISNSNTSVTLSGGTLAINADAALGATGNILKLDVNSTTTGGLEFLNSAVTIARPVTLASPTRVISNVTNSSTISGLISGGGQLVKDGPGLLAISNGSNSFSGGTLISAGTLQTGADNVLPAGGAVSFANAAGVILDLKGSSQSIGSLVGGGTTGGTVVLGGGSLTVGGDNSPANFAGKINGPGSLSKGGTGTQTVSGAGNSVGALTVTAGGFTVNGGALSLTQTAGPALTVGAPGAASVFTVQGGATVDASTTNTAVVSGGAGSAIIVDGANSTLKTGFQFVVSGGGAAADTNGAVTVQNGGQLQAGTFLIVGAGGGLASLTVQSGGTVVSPSGTVGFQSGNNGTATVTGVGSSWTNTSSLGLGGLQSAQQGGVGTLTVANSGSVAVGGVTTLFTSASSLTVNCGTFQTGGLATGTGATPSIFVSDPVGGTALTVGTDGSSSTFGGSIADAAGGPGTVTKTGTGLLTLTGHLTNTGGYHVGSGTLTFSGAIVQPGSGSLTADAGATINYAVSSQVFGGFLRGPGSHVVSSGATFNGTTAFSDAVINQTGPASVVNFTNSGAFTNSSGQTLTWNGGTNTAAGRFTINGPANVSAFESDGVISINSGGTLGVSGSSSLVLGGGSRTSVGSVAAPGGSITAPANVTIELNGGLLVNNGTIGAAGGAGKVNINFGGVAKGAGNYAGGYNVNDGGTFSPGNSPGTMTSGPATWGSGGAYQWEINDATGTAGTNWDLSAISGGLNVAAGTTTNSHFTVALDTLTGANVPGSAADFDPTHSYVWPIAEASGGITGFSTADVVLNTAGFSNPTNGGSFGLALSPDGQTLSITFTPVPEPGTMVLTAAGLGVGLLIRGHRRRRLNACR
jgi:fibronectin-binding autotransporter adhesin